MPQFLILAKDFLDGEALMRRMNVRENHLSRMAVEKAAAKFICGGATLTEDGKMNGSMLVVEMATIEEVKEWLVVDPYVTGKVWDDVQIIPFRMASVQ